MRPISSHKAAMHMMRQSNLRKAGFTLLEMSIVLAIIGLIIAGIFVGQNLISAAQVEKQISQLATFDAGVNAFLIKYNCLPGDCSNASQLGFGDALGSYNSTPNGNGDGIIYCNGSGDTYRGGTFGGGCMFAPNDWGENVNFWYHLYQAGLIPPTQCITYSNTPQCNLNYLGTLTPRPMLLFQPYDGQYGNGFSGGIGVVYTVPANSGTPSLAVPFKQGYQFAIAANFGGILRGQDVMAVDSKIDDGLPGSGNVQAKMAGAATISWGGCVNTSVNPAVYCSDNASLNGFSTYMVVGVNW